MAWSEEIASALASRSSRLPGFHRLPLAARQAIVAQWAGLSDREVELLGQSLALAHAETLIENVIGTFPLPLGIATNFTVNGLDVLVPMAIEEPSVVAAASHAAFLARQGGGFEAAADESLMIGQVQVLALPHQDLDRAAARILATRDEILRHADAQNPQLVSVGGGVRDLVVRSLPDTAAGPMLLVHLLVDVRDAMGANAVNTACEAVAPLIERASGGTVNLRILSNLADRRLARAVCRIPASALSRAELSGETVAQRIVAANVLAREDPYRAATHNKGIMNGIDAVVMATGNDWRAAEAAAHAYAARDGEYRALTDWRVTADGELVGSLELPVAVGTVGGTTRAHPAAALALKILGVTGARELAQVVVSVGLAQNLAALRALVSEGIQRGHMALHARQLALAAGAPPDLAGAIAEQMVAEGQITAARAAELVAARKA